MPTTSAPSASSALGEVRSDEAGGAGDERLHANTSLHARRAAGTAARRDRAPRAPCGRSPATRRRPRGRPRSRTPRAPATASRPSSAPRSRRRTAPAACTRSAPRSPAARRPSCFHLAIAPAERAQQIGRGRPRTRRGSSRSRPRPSGRFRRSARARVEIDAGASPGATASAAAAAPRLAARASRARDRACRRSPSRRRGCAAPAATTRGDVRAIDAAVDLDRRGVARRVEQRAHRPDFRLAARDESLAAEARVDRHHEHVVDVAGDLLERDDRRRRD